MTKMTTEPKFDANPLLDAVIERLNLRSDAALCRKIETLPPVISKIRHGRLPLGPTILIRLHEASGMPIREMRRLMGDTQGMFRCGREG